MAVTVTDVRQLLERQLLAQRGCVQDVELPPGEAGDEWALFEEIRVSALPGGGFDVRFIEGPGFVAARRDPLVVAGELVESVRKQQGELEGVVLELVIDPSKDVPNEWIAAVEDEARKLIAEREAFMFLVDGTDPESDGVVESAVATLLGERSMEIAFIPGPRYDELGGDESAPMLFASVIERVKKRVPQLASWSITLVWDD